jgi:hypothetical protein
VVSFLDRMTDHSWFVVLCDPVRSLCIERGARRQRAEGVAFARAGAGRKQVIANPATACKALVALPGTGYTNYGSCVSTIGGDVAAYRDP